MSTVHFTATKLPSGKQGIIKPNEKGYYPIILGALNSYNKAGSYWTYKGAEQLFQSSSMFMKYVADGCLYAELGHPKRLPNERMEDFLERNTYIDERNWCCHIAEVWLDFDYGKKNPELGNPELIAIMGLVKPAGAMKHAVEGAFENGAQNVCFSIRAFTRDKRENGRLTKYIDEIVTFDFVTLQGIPIANKFSSPSTESFNVSELVSYEIDRKVLESIVNHQARSTSLSTESSKMIFQNVLERSFSHVPRASKPVYHSW